MTWVAAAIAGTSLISGGIKLAAGAGQKKQGKRLLAQIGESPQETMPEEIGQNVRDAGVDATVGLPSAVYNKAMQNIQRNQLTSMIGLSGRQRLMALPTTLSATNNATLGLDAADAQQRLANKKVLYGARGTAAAWKDKLWNTNVKTPWDNNYNYAMGLIGQGNANVAGGAADIGAAGMAYLGAKKSGVK